MRREKPLIKRNILARTNILVCLIVITGFLATAVISYQANYATSITNIEHVSTLTSEGIYYQITSALTKPINVSLTMANDSLLKNFLSEEEGHMDEESYITTIREYLNAYREKYSYDSVFLVSTQSGRYYSYQGLDRVLTQGNPENAWYYAMLDHPEDYSMNVDNDEVIGAGNEITVFVNCKIKNDQDEILGVVGVGVRIRNLQKLLQEYKEDFGVEACLVDSGGTIEISAAYTGYEKVNLFDVKKYGGEIQKRILDWEGEDSNDSFWAGEKTDTGSYIVTRYLSELNWHLVVEQDTHALIEQLNRQMLITVLILLLILGVILFIITRAIRSFNRRITELTQDQEQERRTVFEKATEQLYENIYELDITNDRPANRATEEYFESLGAPRGTPYSKGLQMIAGKQIKEEFRQGYMDTFLPQNVLRAYQEGRETLRYEFMISQDGENFYWMRITAQIIRLESDGSLHMLVYRQNIDREKRRESQMQRLAHTDEMTGLLTKTATERQIDSLLQSDGGGMYAFFIFDIDNFKQANDQFGHAFGDEIIRAFSRAVREQFRASDIVGRVGGDEFAAFLPVKDEAWAAEKAKSVSAALRRDYRSGEKSWEISASIGVAAEAGRGNSYSTFYRHADRALYETKKKGKNGFTLYQESMDEE